VSVLRDIRAAIVTLVQGSAVGGIRMPAAGLFLVVGDDVEVQQADAADSTPRPVYLGAGSEVADPTIPSDVSGDYHWEARMLPMWILYAYDPSHTVVQRDSLMDDDERAIRRVLMEPLNIALTTNWAKCIVDSARSEIRDDEGVAALKVLSLSITVVYREDWAT